MTDQYAQIEVPGTTPPTPAARRILDTAGELFYRHGIHAVGVDRIAAESGVTKRTLYNSFGAKQTLVAAYLADRHTRWWTGLEQRIGRARPPRVLAVFDAYAEEFFPSGRGCAFLNAAGELEPDDPAYRVVRAHKVAVSRRIRELLEEDLPGLEDPGLVADHLFLLLEGAIAHQGIDGDARLLGRARQIAGVILSCAPAATLGP